MLNRAVSKLSEAAHLFLHSSSSFSPCFCLCFEIRIIINCTGGNYTLQECVRMSMCGTTALFPRGFAQLGRHVLRCFPTVLKQQREVQVSQHFHPLAAGCSPREAASCLLQAAATAETRCPERSSVCCSFL